MTRPYYHKKYKKNNKKLIIAVLITSVVIFTLTMAIFQSKQLESKIDLVTKSTNNYLINLSKLDDPKALALKTHDLVNEQRINNGVKPLVWDDKIALIAEAHSNDMIQTGDFSHVGLSDRLQQMGCPYGSENIEVVTGYHLDQVPNVAINDWMNSYGHKENVLNLRFTSEGIGFVQDGNRVLITEDFC